MSHRRRLCISVRCHSPRLRTAIRYHLYHLYYHLYHHLSHHLSSDIIIYIIIHYIIHIINALSDTVVRYHRHHQSLSLWYWSNMCDDIRYTTFFDQMIGFIGKYLHFVCCRWFIHSVLMFVHCDVIRWMNRSFTIVWLAKMSIGQEQITHFSWETLSKYTHDIHDIMISHQIVSFTCFEHHSHDITSHTLQAWMRRALCVYCITLDMDYMQGLNEILAPIVTMDCPSWICDDSDDNTPGPFHLMIFEALVQIHNACDWMWNLMWLNVLMRLNMIELMTISSQYLKHWYECMQLNVNNWVIECDWMNKWIWLNEWWEITYLTHCVITTGE